MTRLLLTSLDQSALGHPGRLYFLSKIHKVSIPGRQIVSYCAFPASRTSLFVDHQLSALVKVSRMHQDHQQLLSENYGTHLIYHWKFVDDLRCIQAYRLVLILIGGVDTVVYASMHVQLYRHLQLSIQLYWGCGSWLSWLIYMYICIYIYIYIYIHVRVGVDICVSASQFNVNEKT